MFCKKCGVELKPDATRCPLCKLPITGEADLSSASVLPDSPERGKNPIWFLELFSFFAFAGFLIVFAVDFAYGAALSWSRIPLASIVFAWFFIFIIYKSSLRPYLLVTLEMVNLIIFLALLDKFSGNYSWFVRLALPVILITGILFLLVILFIRSFKLKTLLSISIATLAVGIFLISLEVVLHNFHQNAISISWSLVAFACILPVSGLFFYMQIRLNRKGNSMKKFFHI